MSLRSLDVFENFSNIIHILMRLSLSTLRSVVNPVRESPPRKVLSANAMNSQFIWSVDILFIYISVSYFNFTWGSSVVRCLCSNVAMIWVRLMLNNISRNIGERCHLTTCMRVYICVAETHHKINTRRITGVES